MKPIDLLIELLCRKHGEMVSALTDSEKFRFFRALVNATNSQRFDWAEERALR